MKTIFLKLLTFLLLLSFYSTAQNEKSKIYNPEADAKKDLEVAINLARTTGKHVLLQIGGNWCPWCIKFHAFINSEKQIDSLIKADFVFLLVNYSKEKQEYKNLDLLKQLDYPQRFGFPVIVVLDGSGKRLHTQDSGFLESGKGYDKEKVMTFLKCWTPKALKAESYK